MSVDNLINKEILADFILNEIDSDKEFFLKQLGFFSKHLADFKDAGNNPERLAQLAHKIRVGCRCFGAEAFESIMVQVEDMQKNNTLKPQSEIFKLALPLIDPIIITITKASEEIFRKVA